MNRRSFIKAAIVFVAIPSIPLVEVKRVTSRGKMCLIDINNEIVNLWELPDAFLTQEISKFTFNNSGPTRIVKAIEIRHPRISHGEPRTRQIKPPLHLTNGDTLSIAYNLHLNW